jgi:protein-tyrosine phosphatase
MPEGLTPSCLKTFDGLVEKVVRDYTLKGIHVLAHCRAGVGRAGLTACAWAIKMGIAGPKPGLEDQMLELLDGRDDTHGMSTVERVIGLIRRRRSVKAIETFEQVNFLASYVGWLRRESGEAAASEAKCLG